MALPEITHCPGTLAKGFTTYSRTCLKNVYNGKKVNHIFPYDAPSTNADTDELYHDNRTRISLSGVQEKFSVVLEKNKLRLVDEGERGTHILKPIPKEGNKSDQMPMNEHLTMQIARQVYGIETAANALIFFSNGDAAYITKRFDVKEDGSKWAQEDFASLSGKTPQTHGEHYKYQGNYLELFELMKAHLPAYPLEATKLYKLLMFNYLFYNGDAHLKNFSLIETPLGDYRLSPAYDLLNSRIHVDDQDFALDDGLLPKSIGHGTIHHQFKLLGTEAGIKEKIINNTFELMLSKSEQVAQMVEASYLNEKPKRNFIQGYQGRVKRLLNI